MSQRFDQLDNRRQFLRFMAASPLLVHGAPGWLQLGADGEAITDPQDALNVFDFREVAEKVLPPAHYGYLATGVDDDGTLRANREGFISSIRPTTGVSPSVSSRGPRPRVARSSL